MSDEPTSSSTVSDDLSSVASSVSDEPISVTSAVSESTSVKSTVSDEPTSVSSTGSDDPTSQTMSEETTSVQSTVSDEPASALSTVSEEPTSSSTVSDETTSVSSTVKDEPTSVSSTVIDEPRSSTMSDDPTSVPSTVSDEHTSVPSTVSDEPTSESSTVSDEPTSSSTVTDTKMSSTMSDEPTNSSTKNEEITSVSSTMSDEPTSFSTMSDESTSSSTVSHEPKLTSTVSDELASTSSVSSTANDEPTSVASTMSDELDTFNSTESDEFITETSTLITSSSKDERTSVASTITEGFTNEPEVSTVSLFSPETVATTAHTLPTQYEISTTAVISTLTPNVTCTCRNEICVVEDTKDCTKYYACDNGVLTSKQCSIGYLFSRFLMRCDIASRVECDVKSSDCTEGDGYFSAVDDCSSYVICYHGIPYKKACPEGLYYNPSKRTCDSENACGSDPVNPTARNLDVECDCEHCLLPDTENCSRYFFCLSGSAYDEYCSNGLLFNPEIGSCDYQDEVSCVVPSPECRTMKNGDVPFIGDCRRYFHCVAGVAYARECPEGLHFGEVSGQCEEPCDAGCDSTLECKVTTTLHPMCEDPNGFYPNPSDCRTFYKCTKGRTTLSQCVGDEHFNPVDQICQDPCQAKCDLSLDCPGVTPTSTDVTTKILENTTGVTTTTDIASDSTTDNDYTPFPKKHTLSEFTDSSDSTSTTVSSTTPEPPMTHPETVVTEDIKTTSILDESSTSDLRTTFGYTEDIESTSEPQRTTRNLPGTSVSESTTGVTTGTSPCIEPDGVYPKPGDCRSFYLCVYGVAMQFECNKHMHFSPVTRHCEHQCNAQCDPTLDCSSIEDPESSSPLPLTFCLERDVLPKRGSCDSYIDCTSGRRDKERCPRGLHFNPSKRVCDIPQIAGCGEPPKPLPVSDLYYTCPCDSCLMHSENNCIEYFLCLDRRAYRMKCTGGLLFDRHLNTCNFASKIRCHEDDTSVSPAAKPPPSTTKRPPPSTTKRPTPPPSTTKKPPTSTPVPPSTTRRPTSPPTTRPVPTGTTKPTTKPIPSTSPHTTIRPTPTTRPTADASTVAPRNYRCKQPNGMFKNPDNCGSFIHCANWWPYIKECPGGLHFSQENLRCDYPCNAKCDVSLSCVSTPIPKQDPICSCQNCLLPNPESCTKYYQCQDGISTKRNCPRGKTFDTKHHVCDWAHRVDCKHSEICPRSNGLFPYKGDCHKFVHCGNGIPYVKSCPSGLHFDPKKTRCEWPSGNCESSPQQGPTKGGPSSTPALQWQCPTSFGTFRSEDSCNTFYICSHGTSQVKECPKDLVYNSKHQACDWPQNVNCHKDERHHQRRCRRFDHQVRCPNNRDNAPHAHCDMYYDCSTGKACPKRCSDGLYFNTETLMCDLPSNVMCQKRDGALYSLKNFADICRQKLKGHMRDPANPACFYRCQRTRVLRGCCAGNRTFNEQKNTCEWIRN